MVELDRTCALVNTNGIGWRLLHEMNCIENRVIREIFAFPFFFRFHQMLIFVFMKAILLHRVKKGPHIFHCFVALVLG